MVIVDFGLLDQDRKQLIHELRTWSTVPILVLSARQNENEKVSALNAGANDYQVQPFGIPELLASLRNCAAKP